MVAFLTVMANLDQNDEMKKREKMFQEELGFPPLQSKFFPNMHQ